MRKQEAPPSAGDREVDILLKEYQTLRSEINTHVVSQTQLTTVTVVLLGGVTAAAPFLVSSDSQGLHLRIPLVFLVLTLLIISTLFASLQWASMAHDIQIAYIAQYLHKNIRSRVTMLLGGSASVFNWEGYRNGLMYPQSNKPNHLLVRLTVIALAIAQYIPTSVPAAISLFAAGLLYFTNFSIPAANAIGWLDIGLIIFNSFYILASIPSAIYISRAYEEIPSHKQFI